MRILSGTVVDGRIEVPEGTVEDGTTVTVIIPDGDTTFELTPEEVRELQSSIDQASRGEVVDGWQLLEQLRG
jgi:hypothetical protein